MTDKLLNIPFSPTTDTGALGAGIHIWLLEPRQLSEQARALAWDTLSSTERERARTFQRKRDEFIATRALVRLCLSHYTGIPPDAIHLHKTANGKPYLKQSPLPLEFNLSHCDGLIALAISDAPLGIDIETLSQRPVLKIAEHYFHPEEIAQFHPTSEPDQRELFFTLWTLKEAFFKALGGGISTGLDKIVLRLQDDHIHFRFAPELDLEEREWQLSHTRLRDTLFLGLAYPSDQPLPLSWFDAHALFTH